MRSSIIEIIFHCNNMVDECVSKRVFKNKEYKEAINKTDEAYDKLFIILCEEQKKQFIRFTDLNAEERNILNEKYFKEGVKVGINFAVECFCDDIF